MDRIVHQKKEKVILQSDNLKTKKKEKKASEPGIRFVAIFWLIIPAS